MFTLERPTLSGNPLSAKPSSRPQDTCGVAAQRSERGSGNFGELRSSDVDRTELARAFATLKPQREPGPSGMGNELDLI